MRWTRTCGALLGVGCLLAACSSKSGSSSHDAAAHGDATKEGDGSASEAGIGSDASDSSTLDAAVLPPKPDGETHPDKCTGPKDCGGGQICCSGIGGIVVDSTCTAGTTCPSGFVQVCGTTGGEACVDGSCREYMCTVNGSTHTSTIYACSLPVMISNLTCTHIPDAGFFSPDAHSESDATRD